MQHSCIRTLARTIITIHQCILHASAIWSDRDRDTRVQENKYLYIQAQAHKCTYSVHLIIGTDATHTYTGPDGRESQVTGR